jgi:hypothetical protein
MRISREQQKAATLIAASLVAAEIAEEFHVCWKAKQTPHNRALIDYFEAECERVARGIVDGMNLVDVAVDGGICDPD